MVHVTNEVRSRSSSDEGATWSSNKQLDTGLLHLTDPMVADGDDVWVLEMKNISTKMDWCCPRDAGDLYLLHSGNRGANWDAARVIAASAGASGAERPQVAARGDGGHVTIWDGRGTNPRCMAGPT